jgi:hypothetical protein
MKPNDIEARPQPGGPNSIDIVFIIFMGLVLVAVSVLGMWNFKEGQHVEDAKRNGEAWMAWLAEAGKQRMDKNYEVKACAGGVKPTKPEEEASADTPTPGTWGACLAYLQTQSDLKNLVNTFFNKPVHVVEKCDKTDMSTRGAIFFNNLVPTPPGSAVPMVVNPLTPADAIDSKLQIRIIVCDKGGYPIKVGEVEF